MDWAPVFRLTVALWISSLAPYAVAAQVGDLITEVVIEQEGRPIEDRLIDGLIETRPGEPLSMRDVRETVTHLMTLNRFEDVQARSEPVVGGLRIRWVLFPLHPVDRIELRGDVGTAGDVRRVITERYGTAPSAGRAAEIAETIRTLYRQKGYAQARITPRIEQTHNPDRATMAFEIVPGPRAAITSVEIEEVDASDRPVVTGGLAIRVGAPYDDETVARELGRYEALLRRRGFYEARATHMARFAADGNAALTVNIDRGPNVVVTFAGDELPESDRERLVPVRAEGSVDEDLLEDSNFAIEEYLRARGYRNAMSQYTRMERDGQLNVAFTVSRGPRYVLDDVQIVGNVAVPAAELTELLGLTPGEPFVQAAVNRGIGLIRDAYRTRGFTRASVQTSLSDLPPEQGADRRVQVRVNIAEGARTLVGSIEFTGNEVTSEGELRARMTTTPGRPYSDVELTSDRDRIELEYRNRGYEGVVVDANAELVDGGTRADVTIAISEGVQILVDQVIIVGNQRTSIETIERELLVKSGEPLGYSALIESQQRLAALGLFRRIRIEPLAHGGEPRRDVLVQVEEAPPTTIDYGGGLEGGTRLRPTGEGGTAEERFEFVPRGFFGIGRRNLWGKNRAVNLFTRVSFRARDMVLTDSALRLDSPPESSRGFNEYRVFGTFREPRIFNSRADVLVTGILDQAIRSSFNFITREVRGEAGLRLTSRYSLAGRYSYEHTRLFDQQFTDQEKPLIDRVFPQVRLSKFSSSTIRDTRDDPVDPTRGTFAIFDTELAARAIGSEVGFVKAFAQGFAYYRLPIPRRTVVAFSARLGMANGFPRAVPRVTADGAPEIGPDGNPMFDFVDDLPASERFFAGGDTTVRGFSLDRLGTFETITESGFPKGGNGVIVLNGELRMALIGAVGGAVFLDAGNVFARASAIDLGELRGAAGFGVRYRSPVGPIRIDLGFKLDRRELSPGRLERRSVLHISLGQAF